MSKQNGKKRNDTIVKSIEKNFGVDLGYRTDAKLHAYLKETGVPSLSKLLKLTHEKGK